MATRTYGAVTSQPRSTALVPPLSQNTAPVFEFRCLFTHDVRRKNAKRWHDGVLRYHTFNKRVMVYDSPNRILVGDSYMRDREMVEDGDEFSLERSGALIQVGEQIGSENTDLSAILDRQRRQAEPETTSRIVRNRPGHSNNPPSHQTPTRSHVQNSSRITARPTPKSPQSPFDMRHAQGNVVARPSKRRRNDEDHVPLCEILQSTKAKKPNTIPAPALANATAGSRQNIARSLQVESMKKSLTRPGTSATVDITLRVEHSTSETPITSRAHTHLPEPRIKQNISSRARTETAEPEPVIISQASRQKRSKGPNLSPPPRQGVSNVVDLVSAASQEPPTTRPADTTAVPQIPKPIRDIPKSMAAVAPIVAPDTTSTRTNLQQLRLKSQAPRKMLFCQDLPPRKAKKKRNVESVLTDEGGVRVEKEVNASSERQNNETRNVEQPSEVTNQDILEHPLHEQSEAAKEPERPSDTSVQSFSNMQNLTIQPTTPKQDDAIDDTTQIPPSQDHHHPEQISVRTPIARDEEPVIHNPPSTPTPTSHPPVTLDEAAIIHDQPPTPSPDPQPVQLEPTTSLNAPPPAPSIQDTPAALPTALPAPPPALAPPPIPAPTGLQKPFTITRPTTFARAVMPKPAAVTTTTTTTRASSRIAALTTLPADPKANSATLETEGHDISAVKWDESGPWTIEAWDLLGWIPPERRVPA